MKIKIEVDETLLENEIQIHCKSLDEEIQKIQKAISMIEGNRQKFTFYQEGKEYYFPLQEIIFFETSENIVNAHTKDAVYQIKYRLYELEKLLPSNFLRVSKSTILNISHIYSIEKSLTASSLVQFEKTHKQVYVSRFYYKELKERLEERRYYEI